MNLESRLKRIEVVEAAFRPEAERRVVRIIAGEHDRDAALELAKANGFDPDDDGANDLIIMRTVVSAKGQEPWSKPPYVAGLPV